MEDRKNQFDLNDLYFYFNAREKDSIDLGARSRKLGALLDLREKLMCLPDSEFQATVHTLQGMLNAKADKEETKDKKDKKDATTLYQVTQQT